MVTHPLWLAIIALCCAPMLFPLARFFFEDLETVKAEAGLHSTLDILLWVVGQPRQSLNFQFKVVGFLGVYGIVVFLAYVSICRILG